MPEVIKFIEKLNVQDGDIIILPVVKTETLEMFTKALNDKFTDKRFVVISMAGDMRQDGRSGIRVLHLDQNGGYQCRRKH